MLSKICHGLQFTFVFRLTAHSPLWYIHIRLNQIHTLPCRQKSRCICERQVNRDQTLGLIRSQLTPREGTRKGWKHFGPHKQMTKRDVCHINPLSRSTIFTNGAVLLSLYVRYCVCCQDNNDSGSLAQVYMSAVHRWVICKHHRRFSLNLFWWVICLSSDTFRVNYDICSGCVGARIIHHKLL